MKRTLMIDIECGAMVCGSCCWWDKEGSCTMFDVSLVDKMVRHNGCLDAEEKYKNLIEHIHARYKANPDIVRRAD